MLMSKTKVELVRTNRTNKNLQQYDKGWSSMSPGTLLMIIVAIDKYTY